MVNGTNGCADCDLRTSDVQEMQQELESLKSERRRLFDEVGELSGRLDEAEAISEEKDENIKTLELSLSVEQEARATLNADLHRKNEECLSLLNSLEMLSTSSKEKNEENKNLIEQLRAEIKDKTEEIEKNQQTMRALTSARSAAEEINVSLQETVTSLSEQLYRITSEKEKLDIAKEKVDYLYEEMRAKVEDLTRRLETKENDSNLTQNAEIDRLTAVNRSLNEQLKRIESEHKNAVNDLKMMNENQTQFIEVLTRKVEQFKEDKAQWLLEKSRFR
ncbi:hypothetical protein Q1695_015480 [Nippostrongylus brasiliensis]|nr:hypothetical protein Q1695_015480 [Nippostrongylus brasiliensis]